MNPKTEDTMSKNKNSQEALHDLISTYLKRFPTSQNPLDNLFAFKRAGLAQILVQAKGRQVLFINKKGVYDGCNILFIHQN